MLCMALLCLVYLVCSIRTNLVFFLIFFTLVPAFCLLCGAFLNAAKGNARVALKCQEAAGAFTFVTCILGWYIFLAIMLASVDFPFDLPRKSFPHYIGRMLSNLIQLSTFLASSRVRARRRRSTMSSKTFDHDNSRYCCAGNDMMRRCRMVQ